MDHSVVQMSAEPLPGRAGKLVVIVVDGTSRAYDLWDLAFGTPALADLTTGAEAFSGTKFYVDMYADGGIIYYLFGPTAPTVDETAGNAAAANPLVFVANSADALAMDTRMGFVLQRDKDRFLALKTTAAGTVRLRLRVSSYRNDTATTSGA